MDTIRLKFKNDILENDEYFSEKIHSKELEAGHIIGSRFVRTNNNWRKKQQDRGIYVPKYWIEQDFKYPETTYFCIEFSVPKLIYGENITALKNDQFEQVIQTIVDFCKSIGIYLFSDQIKKAIPTLVAFGKNINITNFCTAHNAIRTLKPFDYKAHNQHRTVDFSDHKHGGKETIFSQTNETTKVYDKTRELLNNAKTTQENKIAYLLKNNQYFIDGKPASEIIRFELTMKTPRKIASKLKSYLGKLPPTFENIFKIELWDEVIKNEVNQFFNHPLQKIIFLSLESQPFIDNFLDSHYHHIQTKDTIRGILTSLQEYGLADTRMMYLKRYKSRQTWYNYLTRLKTLQENFDWSELGKLDNVKIHNYILNQFGITTETQQQLDLFDSKLSKNIDIKQRNT